MADLHPSQLLPDPHQPRRSLPTVGLEALADSIRQVGILEPLCVRPLGSDCYQIVAGERRWRAAQIAGLDRLPCRIYDLTEDQAFVVALLENLQRQALSPLEEAMAYQQMLERGIASNRASIARSLGITRQRISQRMKLLELDPPTQARLSEHPDILSEYHGRLLWEVRDLAVRHQMADAAVEGHWSGRQLRSAIERHHREAEARRERDATQHPAGYSVARPGILIRLNFMRADTVDVLETLRRLVSYVESICDGSSSPVNAPTPRS